MSHSFETAKRLTLPVIALGGVVAFPAIPLNLEIEDAPSLAAAEAAESTDSFALLISLAHPIEGDEFTDKDLCPVGTVAKIKQSVKAPEGNLRLVCEGFARAELLHLHRFHIQHKNNLYDIFQIKKLFHL